MADDDGLFLNFKTGSSAAPRRGAGIQKQKIQGSWRERRRVMKSQRPHQQPISKTRSEDGNSEDKAVKKTSGEKKQPLASESQGIRKPSVRPRFDRDTKQKLDENTFLSSLFTSNPEASIREVEADATQLDASNAPIDSSSFAGLGLPPAICGYLETKGIENPTDIQQASIPTLYSGEKDALIIAQTGSGKTLAFLLPILARLISQQNLNRTCGVFAVILSPTRELAAQTFSVCDEICRKSCHWLVPGLVVGGEKKKSEKARLRKGVNFLIGTPGRMADHFDNTRALDLGEVRYVILDEGDRLVELGFEETLSAIMEKISDSSNLSHTQFNLLPRKRATILCSATMNNSTDRLKTLTLESPIWIRNESKNSAGDEEAAPAQLKQEVVIAPAKLRLVTLTALLRRVQRSKEKAVVFLSCTDSVEFHSRTYSNENANIKLQVFRLHGSLSQSDRSLTLAAFSKATAPAVLFTTDVASRGLDAAIDRVIEFDPPVSLEDHLHRAGRTARAGKKGSSTMVLLPSEQGYIDKLGALHPTISTTGYEKLIMGEFGGAAKWQTQATNWHLAIERWLLSDSESLDTARKAFQAHVRAYTTHPTAERDIFNFKGLHLGHLSKAFGLREVPGSNGSHATSGRSKKSKESPKTSKQLMLEAANKSALSSEFNVV